MKEAGFYGKLPVKGDFVSRNLPYEFIDNWDRWLQKVLTRSQDLLGDDWKVCFSGGPLWCFVLAPGLCMSQAVAGVMAPSRDRVDRSFPLVVATPAGIAADCWQLISRQPLWYSQACGVVVQGLDQKISLAAFTERVGALEALQPLDETVMSIPDRTSSGPDYCYTVSEPSRFDEVLSRACRQTHQAGTMAGSLWWHSGTDTIAPCLLVCRRLPKPKQFTAMLTGHWQECGWHVVTDS